MFHRIKEYLIISFPTISILFFIFLNIFLFKTFFDFGAFFPLQGIFFWFLFAPHLVPPLIIFSLGLLQDVIYLSFLGSTPLIFLLSFYLIKKYKNFFLEPSFTETWISFLFIFSLSLFSFWGLTSIINFNYVPIKPLLFEIFVNFLFFPLNYIFNYFFLKKLKLDKRKRN